MLRMSVKYFFSFILDGGISLSGLSPTDKHSWFYFTSPQLVLSAVC